MTTLTRSGERGRIAVWTAGNIVENEGGGFSEPFRCGLSGLGYPVVRMLSKLSRIKWLPWNTRLAFHTAQQRICNYAPKPFAWRKCSGVSVPAGYVWYAGHRRKVEIAFTTALRLEVCHVIEQIREQLRTAVLPVAPNDSRCNECQLQSHCLPGMANSAGRLSRYMTDVVYA